jgi:hypothetical protein
VDTDVKRQVILAAITAAGPIDDTWHERVKDAARRITVMLADDSPVARTIDQIGASTAFTGVITSVTREASSTRAIVTLRTKATPRNLSGEESLRTERTDSPDGLAMARRLRALKGHRVLIWKEVESVRGGDVKVRMVRHVEDLGPDAEANAA